MIDRVRQLLKAGAMALLNVKAGYTPQDVQRCLVEAVHKMRVAGEYTNARHELMIFAADCLIAQEAEQLDGPRVD